MWQYEQAYKNAQPEVKQAISRYTQRRHKHPVLLYWLLGSGTPPYKMSKQASQYMEHPVDGQKCANCHFAYKQVASEDTYICSQVRGEIKPEHWCNQWKPPKLDKGDANE